MVWCGVVRVGQRCNTMHCTVCSAVLSESLKLAEVGKALYFDIVCAALSVLGLSQSPQLSSREN